MPNKDRTGPGGNPNGRKDGSGGGVGQPGGRGPGRKGAGAQTGGKRGLRTNKGR